MRSLLQVFSFDFASRVMLGLVGLVLIRWMTPAEYGAYTLAVSLIALPTQLVLNGLSAIYVVARRTLHGGPSGAFLVLALAGVCVVLAGEAALGLVSPELFAMVAGVVFATALTEYAKAVFQQELQFLRFSLVDAIRSITFCLLVVGLLWWQRSSLGAFEVLAAQWFAPFGTFVLVFARHLDRLRYSDVKRAVELGRWLAIGPYKYLYGYYVALALLSQVDVFALRVLAGTGAVASYGSAFRYYSLVLLALGSIHSVLLPTVQKIQSQAELGVMIRRVNRLSLLLAPVIVLGAWLAGWVLPWIDAGKYPDAVIVFRILSGSALLSLVLSPYVHVLLRCEDFRFLFIACAAALVVCISANVLLVPLLGPTGAALSTLLGLGCVNTAALVRARQHLRSGRALPAAP